VALVKYFKSLQLRWRGDNKGGKIIPENNAFGDKYNITGKLFYM
jgi:hypothetical protein